MRSNDQLIYEAALEKDKEELALALKNGWIDEPPVGRVAFCAITRLAENGHFDACNWLIAHESNPNYAALGAAAGGHLDYLNTLFTAHDVNISYAAWGAAYAGRIDLAEKLITQGATLNIAAWGAAFGNHRDYVENLLERGAFINYAARGAAYGNHAQYAEELVERGANINTAIEGFGATNNKEAADRLLKQGANIRHLGFGAAIGGHGEYALSLLTQGAEIFWMIVGAAETGHQALLTKLLDLDQGTNLTAQSVGACVGGHHAGVKEFLAKANTDLKNEMAFYLALSGHYHLVSQVLKQGADPMHAARGALSENHAQIAQKIINEYTLNSDDLLQASAQGGALLPVPDECSKQESLLKGFIYNGHGFQINELLEKNPGHLKFIIEYSKTFGQMKMHHEFNQFTGASSDKISNSMMLCNIPRIFLTRTEARRLQIPHAAWWILIALSRYASDQDEMYCDGIFKKTGLYFEVWMVILNCLLGFEDRQYVGSGCDRLEKLGSFFFNRVRPPADDSLSANHTPH